MPSGRTHDRITLWCVPLIIGPTFGLTNSLGLTAITGTAFLVGGFMLGPDLDIHSIQYKRWGPIKWIWLPYQVTLKHRSKLSHGPIIGTVLRVIYLAVWIALLTILSVELLNAVWDAQITWGSLETTLRYLLSHYWAEWIAILVGLELGAISHSASDVIGSYLKRKRSGRKKRRKKKRRS